MKNRLATLAVTALVTACGPAGEDAATGPAAMVDTESAEYAAMEYRQGLMHVIAYKAGRLRGMADGDIPVDEAAFVKAANDLVAATEMLAEAFPEGSDSESLAGASNALPDIWDDWNEFLEHQTALQTAARMVAEQAQRGGFAAAQETASEQIGPACGGCHRPYRQRED
jgi:cytochrome c556